MSVREVKKKAPPIVMQCLKCGLAQARIGAPKDWIQWAGGSICGKDACRTAAGAPKFVPPDEAKQH